MKQVNSKNVLKFACLGGTVAHCSSVHTKIHIQTQATSNGTHDLGPNLIFSIQTYGN